MGVRSPLCYRHLPLLPHGGQRGALHEEDFLQEAAALLHSLGDWNPLLQRPLPAHPRGMASCSIHPKAPHFLVGTGGGPSVYVQGIRTTPKVFSVWKVKLGPRQELGEV